MAAKNAPKKKEKANSRIGLGGNQWQTMSGRDLESILAEMSGTLGGVPMFAALQNAVAMLCSDILAQDISKATPQLRRRQKFGSSTIVMGDKHGIARMFALDPNVRHTWIEFMAMTVYWLTWTSNSYIFVKRKQNGDVSQLIPLQSWHVLDMINADIGKAYYEITASNQHERALLGFTSKRVGEEDIIHLRNRMLDGFSGLSTLAIGSPTLETTAAMEKYRGDLVGESGQMRGVFTKKTPGAIAEIPFQRLRQQMGELMRQYAGRKEPIILEDGIEFQATSANPQQTELVKQFDAQVVQTCRLFRIPPHKAFHLINVKYENMEVLEKSYIGDTLDPILKIIEQRMTRQLLTEEDRLSGLFIEFDRSDLTLRDPKVMMEQTNKFYTSGMITMGEGRVEHGWEPGDMADYRLIPQNSTLIDGKGNPVLEISTTTPAPVPKKGLQLVPKEA